MTLSIVVCTRNRPAQIRQCLHHMARAELSPVAEILVIDQSDTPLTHADLPQIDRLRLFATPTRGLARARNLAIRTATGDAIAFTDDDCYIDPQWPTAVARALQEDPAADALFGRVLAYGPPEAVTHHHVRTPFGMIAYATNSNGRLCSGLIDSTEPAAYATPVTPAEHLGAGNNMVFRRRAFEQHGMFIDRLGVGSTLRSGEDTEMQLRLLRAGCRLIYRPEPIIYHDGWVTPEQDARLQDGYACGMLAVFLGFALRGDPLARTFLHFRFRSVQQEIATSSSTPAARKPARYYVDRFAALASGALGGIWLAARHRQNIPRLGPPRAFAHSS